MTMRTTCSAGLVIGALLLSGCGGSGSSSTSTSTPKPAPAPAATSTAAPTPAASATVKIADFMFGPPTVTVAQGAKVTWTNTDASPHTATASSASDATPAFDTGTINQGQSKTVTLTKPGRYAYVCAFHPYMKGTIVVEG